MNLADALALAEDAHSGQRYGNQSYMDGHIIPVMHRAMIGQFSGKARWRSFEEYAVAAVLHDTVEDTFVTLLGLQEMGASLAVVRAVDSVTRRQGETYMGMVRRAKTDPLGRLVKLADNWCNLEASRRDGNAGRVERYEKARALLLTPA